MPVNIRYFFENFREFGKVCDYVINNLKVYGYGQPTIRDEALYRDTMRFLYHKLLETKYKVFYSMILDQAEKYAYKQIHLTDLDMVVFEKNNPLCILEIKKAPTEYIEIPKSQAYDYLNLQEKLDDVPIWYLVKIPYGKYRLIKVNLLAEMVKQNGKLIKVPLGSGIQCDNREELIFKMAEILQGRDLL
jgi:hypothetical protein